MGGRRFGRAARQTTPAVPWRRPCTWAWAGGCAGLLRACTRNAPGTSAAAPGGVLYSTGAVLNLLGRPVLWKGFIAGHELFHLFVMAGSRVTLCSCFASLPQEQPSREPSPHTRQVPCSPTCPSPGRTRPESFDREAWLVTHPADCPSSPSSADTRSRARACFLRTASGVETSSAASSAQGRPAAPARRSGALPR